MKNNLKTKVMLAVLAGNMFCMGSAFALGPCVWYGDSDNANGWKATSGNIIAGRTSGANLTLDGTGGFEDVNIPGTSIEFDYVEIFYGGYSENGNATNNTVTIKGGTFNNVIYGGYSENGNAGGDTPESGNKVIINGGTFNDAWIYGGSAGGNATNNIVTINGGTFNDAWIHGGYSYSGNAENNTVVIKNGNFSGVIYGGQSNSGNAANNSVTINGGTFVDGFYLYGGYVVSGPSASGTSSGNILNLKTKIGGKAAEVKFFQTMNFTLPAGITSGETMLSTAALAVDLSGSGTATVNVDAANGVTLKTGDKITLIDVSEDNTPGDEDGAYDKYVAGDILGGAGKLVYEVDGVEQTTAENLDEVSLKIILEMLQDFEQKSGDNAATIKAVAEGIAASLAFVNQGADMVATSGIDGLYVADSENPTIAAFSGNKTRYNTGSHVDIHGWNAL
ncbi:MAG: hypothetical protein KBS34_00440, partial [Phascolarctobacterium sp.]|nr:hypothetical protein [Candidatus Phascolarctobacterium equi]